MKRQAAEDLKLWYQRQKRKPLVIRGARQVGKSTLVRQFAEELELDLIEINLEKTPLKTLEQDGFNIDLYLQEIEVLCRKRLNSKSLVFIDEIQAQEKMFRALRYFYEEREDIAVIAAGSLLDLFINENEQAPVGRIEYYYLGPMKFTEFLGAMNEKTILDYLANPKERFIEAIHNQCLVRYKEFLFVGGMPEAVSIYINTKNPMDVRRAQEAIIQTYREDFIKYSKHSQIHRVQRIFDYIPGHLGQKMKYSEVNREERSRDLKVALNLLTKARLLIPVYHTNATALPLRSSKDLDTFKLYFLDIGLVNALQRITWTNLVMPFQEESIFKGAMAEQFVAQHLFYSESGSLEPELFYWLRDKKKQNAEVDFIISIDRDIIPVEVKAESSGYIQSLIVFMSEKKWPLAVKLSMQMPKSELVEKKVKGADDPAVFEMKTIPLYLVEKLSFFLR